MDGVWAEEGDGEWVGGWVDGWVHITTNHCKKKSTYNKSYEGQTHVV